MRETAAILKNATERSFVVARRDWARDVDDGRDGAGGRRLRDAVPGAFIYFHAHTFTLCELEKTTDGCVKNYHVDALVEDEELTLLYKVEAGPATVATEPLAAAARGFPATVVEDAAGRLAALEKEEGA